MLCPFQKNNRLKFCECASCSYSRSLEAAELRVRRIHKILDDYFFEMGINPKYKQFRHQDLSTFPQQADGAWLYL